MHTRKCVNFLKVTVLDVLVFGTCRSLPILVLQASFNVLAYNTDYVVILGYALQIDIKFFDTNWIALE
jgi:hypothetical protein